MIENEYSFCNGRQRSRSFTQDAQSVPQHFIPGMFPRHISYQNSNNNLNFCGLLNTQKITKTKALKSFACLEPASPSHSEINLSFDKTAILDKYLHDKERFGNEKSDGSSTPSSPVRAPLITCDECTSDDTSGDEVKNKSQFTFDEAGRNRANSDVGPLAFSASSTHFQDIKMSSVEYSKLNHHDSVASLPSMEDIYKTTNDKDGGGNSSSLSLPATRKISKSFSELRDIPANHLRHSRKLSNMFKKHTAYGSLKKTLSQEKLRLQRERDMLDQVQTELRSKLPITFQVTASLCLNPQLLGRRNTESFVKPRARSRGPSMPSIFKWNPSDDSGDEISWKNKIREKFKSTIRNTEGVKIKIKKPSPKLRQSKKATKSVKAKQQTSLEYTPEKKPSSPKYLTNFTRRYKPYSESERDSTSSADSGIVMRNIDSPNTDDQMSMKQVNEPKRERKYSSTVVFLSKPAQRKQGIPAIANTQGIPSLANTQGLPSIPSIRVTRKISQVNISLQESNLGIVEEGRSENIDIPLTNHVGCPNTIILEEILTQHTPTRPIDEYKTINDTGEPLDEETLKEIEEHLKEIDLVFDITE